jgi:hypothetical protein
MGCVNPHVPWWIAVPSNNGSSAERYREKCKQKRKRDHKPRRLIGANCLRDLLSRF